MKNWIAAMAALPLYALGAHAAVDDFEDISFWIGTGTNRSALVLQWNDGLHPDSMVWGYRWNGSASGMDMLKAVAGVTYVRQGGEVAETLHGADPRLSVAIDDFGWGQIVYSIEFEDSGGRRSRADWDSGFWQYSVHGGSFEYEVYEFNPTTGDWAFAGLDTYSVAGTTRYSAVEWFESPIGASDRQLVDGSWDAWSFAANFAASAVQQPTPSELPMPVVVCRIVGGAPVLSWPTVPGLNYRWEYTDDLQAPWRPIGESLAGAGEAAEFIDETSPRPERRFYRVVVSP